MAKQHLNIRVHGKVQGVFFRDAAKQIAQELGIAGFIRNEPDGTVYIEAEGKEEQMKQFIAWVNEGTDRAHVERVEPKEGEIKGFSEFVVAFYE
ncbi:MAG: acylphosphatase [Patescibacteria group bacterium]|jgi:acylphosphatase